MQKLIDGLSTPSSKSELELFSVPPTQVAVEHSRWREIPLANACTNNGPYEFHIPPSPHMLHLSRNYLIIELRIRNADGTNMVHPAAGGGPLVGPINLIGKTLFNQVRLFLNGSEVFNSGTHYAYRTFLETELNFGKDAKDSQLDAALYHQDTPPADIDTANNTGLAERAGPFQNSARVQVMAPIHCDLFLQDRFLVSQIDVRLQLHRNTNQFSLISHEAQAAFELDVEGMRWLVKTVEVAPSVGLAIERALHETSAKYPIRRVEIKSMNVAAGMRSTPDNALFNGQIPRRLLIGCVDNDAFHGTYTKSPFNFKNFDIRKVSILVAGEYYPAKPLNLHFGDDMYMHALVQLFEGLGMGGENKGNGVDRAKFKNGCCLFAFDLSPDEDDSSGHWDLIKEGPVSIQLEFGTALPNPVEVIAYAEFDNLLTIDKTRSTFVDYKT